VITYAEFKYKIIRSSNLKAYSILLERELFTFLPSYEEYPHEIALRLESLMAKFRKVLIILESDDTVIKSRIDIHEKRLLEVVPRALNEKYALIASLKRFQTFEELKKFLFGVREARNDKNFNIFQHFKFSKKELQNEYESPKITSDQAKQIIGANMQKNITRQQNKMFKNKKVGEQNYENAIDSIYNLKDSAWFQAEKKKKLKKKNQIKNEIGHIDINEFEEDDFKKTLLEIIEKCNKLRADQSRIKYGKYGEIIEDSFNKINSLLQNDQKCKEESGKLKENRQKNDSNGQESIINNAFKQFKFVSEAKNGNNTSQQKSSPHAARMMDENCRKKIKVNIEKCTIKLQATLNELFDIKEFTTMKVSPQNGKNKNKDAHKPIKYDELDKKTQEIIDEVILEAKVSYKINDMNNYKIIKESCEEVKIILQNDVNNRNVQYATELENLSLNVPTQEEILEDFLQNENSTHQEYNPSTAVLLNPFFKNKHKLKLIELTLMIYIWMTINEFKTRRSLQRQDENPGFDYQERYRGKVKIRTSTTKIFIYQAQII